jgi:ssDNA-binding Zn-finger/Zn-ribbon topoisomerase 1/RecB family exonuclease
MGRKITGFSFSAISTFKSCPKAFEYKYIEKLPEAFSSIEGHMGASVHAALEWAFKERLEGREPDLAGASEQFKQVFWDNQNLEKTKVIKADTTIADYFDQGKGFITSFFKRIFPMDKSTTLYLEHKFEMDLADEIKYRGVIDRVSMGEDGVIQVIDYKTGKTGHPLDNLQLPSYALYIFEHEHSITMGNEIRLCIEDLKEERTMVAPFHRSGITQVRSELLRGIEQILGMNAEDFKTNPSVLCQWCGYNQICENPHESVKSPDGEGDKYKETRQDRLEEPARCCPECGGQLIRRNGKYGTFMGCSHFPQCRYTYDLNSSGNEKTVNADTEGKDICPECGSLLTQRKGKYGPFIGCTAYPQCRFTRPIHHSILKNNV